MIFSIILEWTLYAFQPFFCLYCGNFDDFPVILGKFRSLFILPPPSILRTVRRYLIDAACCCSRNRISNNRNAVTVYRILYGTITVRTVVPVASCDHDTNRLEAAVAAAAAGTPYNVCRMVVLR